MENEYQVLKAAVGKEMAQASAVACKRDLFELRAQGFENSGAFDRVRSTYLHVYYLSWHVCIHVYVRGRGHCSRAKHLQGAAGHPWVSVPLPQCGTCATCQPGFAPLSPVGAVHPTPFPGSWVVRASLSGELC